VGLFAAIILLMLPSCFSNVAVERRNKIFIRDSFTRGRPELGWAPYPYFNHDNLRGELDPSSPTGEPGIGVLDNKNVGGFAALSYAKTEPFADFHLETWIFVQVVQEEKGPLNGIAFRVDPGEDKFYRLAAHLTADPSLTLGYVGKDSQHFPVYLAQWKAATLPGGAPKQSGWHRLVIDVKNDQAEIFWDGSKLSGGPFQLDRSGSGYVGVYATTTGGLGIAETKIAGFQVWVNR
jgi:hypothetical protein